MSMTTAPDLPSHPKLPLRATAVLSYSSYVDGFNSVLRISWVWLVATALIGSAADWLNISWTMERMQIGSARWASKPIDVTILNYAFLVVFLLACFSIAVGWHRALILHRPLESSGSNIASASLWRYVGACIGVSLIVMLPAMAIIVPIMLVAQVQVLVVTVVAVYLAALLVGMRLSLVLPACAVGDRSLTFKAAWTQTRGNSWRLVGGVIACVLPPAIVAQVLLYALTPTAVSTADNSVFVLQLTAISTLLTLYYLLTLPIGIGFLSHAYLHFTGRSPRESR